MAKKAETERASNHIEPEVISEYLDAFVELENEAIKIMTEAMANVKNGPRKKQKEQRAEMKQSGIRMQSFNALWAVKKAELQANKAISKLEDEDRDQMKEFATSFADTPFGDFMQARLDEGF